MTDQLRHLEHFELYRKMGRYGMEPKTIMSKHDTGMALDINGRITAKAKAQAIAYARASHATYIIAGGRRGQFSFDDLARLQEQFMRETYDPQLDKYFDGGEYNGRYELLLPSTQSDLFRRARG